MQKSHVEKNIDEQTKQITFKFRRSAIKSYTRGVGPESQPTNIHKMARLLGFVIHL